MSNSAIDKIVFEILIFLGISIDCIFSTGRFEKNNFFLQKCTVEYINKPKTQPPYILFQNVVQLFSINQELRQFAKIVAISKY